jgi:soluble lytic murein transglycosylase
LTQEFNDLLNSIKDNAVDCYRLSNYLLDLGEYRSAINIIENQLLPLAGMNTYAQMSAALAYFTHIRFGLYYQEIVLPASQQTGFDPLLVFSIIRQESLFDKYAGSGQGALGLMQITPDTGQFIADNLGWPPSYTSEDLYRPLISLGLGTHYLMGHRLNFNDELFTTLAAYNAGPNAVSIWRDLSGSDLDLFVEVVRYEETRDYIRSIYEINRMYQSLYSSTP